jgi:hypothetical protein
VKPDYSDDEVVQLAHISARAMSYCLLNAHPDDEAPWEIAEKAFSAVATRAAAHAAELKKWRDTERKRRGSKP